MPDPTAILDTLTRIATDARPLAVFWHVVLAAVLAALGVGWRPSKRMAAALLTIPLASVGVISLVFRSPFNGLVFIGGAVGLGVLAARQPREPARRSSALATVAGTLLVVFGWTYPHFIVEGSPLLYLYAAPTGLLPCPTLAVVIGFAVLADGFGARAWSTLLASMGLFYGLFGMLRLGVMIDIALALGGGLLLVTSWSERAAVLLRQPRSPA